MVYQGTGAARQSKNHRKGAWPLCGGLAGAQTITTFDVFGKIAIFIECCDGFYCKAKTITKVPGPFVVEMTFAQIKPAMAAQRADSKP